MALPCVFEDKVAVAGTGFALGGRPVIYGSSTSC